MIVNLSYAKYSMLRQSPNRVYIVMALHSDMVKD